MFFNTLIKTLILNLNTKLPNQTLFFFKNTPHFSLVKPLLISLKTLTLWYNKILTLKIQNKKNNLSVLCLHQKWVKTFQNIFQFFYSPFIYFTKFITVNNSYYENYRLFFNFKKNRFFINLLNSFNKNYLSLSNGLFIKYFEFKKSLKKKKLLKLLLLKYLRKMFLILKLKNFNLFIKSSGFFLNEFLTLLLQPSGKTFKNPLTQKNFNDVSQLSNQFTFSYIFFLNTKSFSFLKLKKKGRVKRKIQRKLIKLNTIID